MPGFARNYKLPVIENVTLHVTLQHDHRWPPILV